MFVKLIVVASVIVLGVAFFVPRTSEFIPQQSDFTDPIESSFEQVQNGIVQRVEGSIDGTVELVHDGIDDIRERTERVIP